MQFAPFALAQLAADLFQRRTRPRLVRLFGGHFPPDPGRAVRKRAGLFPSDGASPSATRRRWFDSQMGDADFTEKPELFAQIAFRHDGFLCL